MIPEPHIVHIPLGPVGCSSAPVNMFMMDLVKFPNYNHNEFTANGKQAEASHAEVSTHCHCSGYCVTDLKISFKFLLGPGTRRCTSSG